MTQEVLQNSLSNPSKKNAFLAQTEKRDEINTFKDLLHCLSLLSAKENDLLSLVAVVGIGNCVCATKRAAIRSVKSPNGIRVGKSILHTPGHISHINSKSVILIYSWLLILLVNFFDFM